MCKFLFVYLSEKWHGITVARLLPQPPRLHPHSHTGVKGNTGLSWEAWWLWEVWWLSGSAPDCCPAVRVWIRHLYSPQLTANRLVGCHLSWHLAAGWPLWGSTEEKIMRNEPLVRQKHIKIKKEKIFTAPHHFSNQPNLFILELLSFSVLNSLRYSNSQVVPLTWERNTKPFLKNLNIWSMYVTGFR